MIGAYNLGANSYIRKPVNGHEEGRWTLDCALHILIIDDNPDDCLLMAKELSREFSNLRIVQAIGKEELNQALAKGGFDLVITDYMLGWSDGLTIFHEIRSRYPDCPVIMATATGNEEVAVEAMKAGLSDYVLKSTKHMVRIPATVRSVMEQCRQRQTIKDMESRYRQLFEGVPVGLYRTMPDGRITEANQALVHMLGYADRESLVAVNMADLHVSPEEYGKCLEHAQSEGGECTSEVQMRRSDGEIRWMLHGSRLARSEDGQALYYEGSLSDITSRKESEEALTWEGKVDAAMAQLSSALMRAGSHDETSKLVLDYARRLTESAYGYVGFIDPETGYLNASTMTSEIWDACKVEGKDIVFKKHVGLWGWSINNRRSILTNDAAKDPRSTGVPADHVPIRRFLSVPALAGDQLIGQIALANSTRDYTMRDLMLVERLADLYAISTLHARSEEAIRRSEERYRNLVETARDCICTFSLDGTITSLNPVFEEITGWRRDEWIGKHFEPLLHPDDVKPATDLAAGIKRDKGAVAFELRILTKSGEYRRLEFTATLQTRDGAIIGVLGVARDVTERVQAQEERARLATAIEQAAESIVITDPRGIIQYVNPFFEKVTGFSREEVVGQKPFILKSGRQDEALYKGLWETISRGEVWKGHFINKRKDGSLFEEEATISPVRDRMGNIISFVAVKRDVTQEVKLERQLRQAQKMEALGTLSGGIAHDFNNILGIIFGYSEMALMDVQHGAPLRENLQQVLKAANRAKDLVQQILAFSRQSDQERKPVQISLIVKEALKMLRSSLPSTIEIQEEVISRGVIEADPTQVHQILMNLCTNAGHAMRDKGGTLHVSLNDLVLDESMSAQYPGLKSGPYLKLSVSDTGHGMEQAVIDRIFEPFFTTKAQGEGTGMGLAVVHGIVKSHGGSITVYSEPGRGTTFHVYLPAIKTRATQEAPAEGPLPRGTERVLFVDDEPALALSGKQMLERLGYRVIAKTSSTEALEAFREQPDRFDLVVSDLTMPNMTGLDLAEELMRIRSDIPIIICTGFSRLNTAERARKVGIRKLIMKPLVLRQLAETIRRTLGAEEGATNMAVRSSP